MTEPVHTQFAMKAIDLASVFKAVVGAEPVASTSGPSFQIELSAPEGPSTGGGAHAHDGDDAATDNKNKKRRRTRAQQRKTRRRLRCTARGRSAVARRAAR